MNLPEYKLVGSPYKVACHGKHSKCYYQGYRLLPGGKLQKAPCCIDKQTSQRKAVAYVEAHIRKHQSDPVAIYAATTINDHLKTYEEAMHAEHRHPKYVKMTMTRLRRICKLLGFKFVKDIDGLRLKAWASKQAITIKTARDHVAAMKAFTRFLFMNNRAESDQLGRTTLAVKGDLLKASNRKRRCITPEEFQRLLVAAADGAEIHGLTGSQRRMLYIITASTGFRAQECGSLTPRSFNLDDDQPTVMIDCTISKRRKFDVQEIREDVAELFREWLDGKPADEKLWPGWWWSHAADMLTVDLMAADVERETPEGIVDFHAVGRVHFITKLVATSAPVPLVQRIARLSSAALLDRYYKPGDQARRDVVDAMPSVLF